MTTIVTTASSGPYTAVASTGPFAVDFQSLSEEEIAVYLDYIPVSNYTFTRNDDGTGSVLMNTPVTGEVIIASDPNYKQETEFGRFGAFYPDQINPPLDRQARMLLALRDSKLDLPVGDGAGMFIALDANNKPIFSTGTGADAGLRTDLAASTGSSLVAYIATGAGAIQRTVLDRLNERASALDFGVSTSAAENDAAFAAAFAAASHVHVPAGEFIVTTLQIPANTHVTTAGKATKFKQKSATGPNTRIIQFTGSNSSLGDCTVEGQLNQAGDTTGEQNPGILVQGNATVGDLSGITIGNVTGINIRGDVVYIGGATGYTAKRVTVGKVYGSNVYRNVVTVAGGAHGVTIRDIDGEQVGQYHYDHEPNAGNGPSIGIRIDRIRGRNVAIVAPDTGSYIEGVSIGHFEYDPAIATSAPDYAVANPTVPTFTWPYPFQFRNVKSVHISTCNIVGAPGPAFNHIYNAGEIAEQFITGNKWTIANCCQTTGTNYINGAKGHAFLALDELEVTLGASTHWAVAGCSMGRIGPVAFTTLATPTAGSGLISNSDDLAVGPVKHVAGTGGSLIGGSTNRVRINGGNFAGDRLLSNTSDAILIGVVSPALAINVNSTAHTHGCTFGGVKYGYRFESATTPVYVDQATGNFVVTNAQILANGTGFFNTSVGYKVAGNLVVGPRATGWTAGTGTALKGAWAAYAGQTHTASYVQATVQALDNAARDTSQRVKAIEDALRTHGLIN